jgi:hypothetical protein
MAKGPGVSATFRFIAAQTNIRYYIEKRIQMQEKMHLKLQKLKDEKRLSELFDCSLPEIIIFYNILLLFDVPAFLSISSELAQEPPNLFRSGRNAPLLLKNQKNQ